jgi:hypothetical protein
LFDLAQSVSPISSLLKEKIRSIGYVTSAVAFDALKQTIDLNARGEILELQETATQDVLIFARLWDVFTNVKEPPEHLPSPGWRAGFRA